ncbi:hypothetical protein GJ496_001738 [Pomphorhynchus laevis]|nr:hypothetical protein GJ496_001738 [Pomphorhynchus laevis]
MPVGEIDSVSSTVITGAILLFNVICGTGSLTLPKAFEDAGVLYSAISLGAISLFSVLGACTIADCLAICNKSSAAYDSEHWQDNNEVLITNAIEDNHSDEVHHNSDDERFISVENEPLLSNAVCNDISSEYRSRTVRCKELGQVIRCIFPGWVCFMLTMSMFLYLTGDLSIYLVTVGKTITELACNAQPVPGENTSFWLTMDLVNKQTRCSNAMPLSTINFYRISVVGFWFVFLLIAFLKPEKSKFIHYVSSFCRFVSLSAMIVISVMHCFQPNKSLTTLMKKKKKHKFVNGPLAALFGNALYAFMCHHSVSRLIEPIVLANGKKPYKRTVFGVFVLVLILYLTLCISAHFAFGPNISSLYTLNFSSKRYWPLNIFILLTPVVMIASSFPILLYTLARSCEQLIRSDIMFVS